jgi:hypothetical protein
MKPAYNWLCGHFAKLMKMYIKGVCFFRLWHAGGLRKSPAKEQLYMYFWGSFSRVHFG